MKKFSSRGVRFSVALLIVSIMAVPQAVVAQDHVVPPAQIQNDVSRNSALRQQQERQLKDFLATDVMQKAMRSEGVNPRQVTNAVSQLNDAELARLAARTQKAQRDFAAGGIGLGIFTLIGVVVVAAILIGILV